MTSFAMWPGAALPPKTNVRGATSHVRSARWWSAMMCSAFRCWRLYSWMRFTCTSKSDFRIGDDACAPRRISANRRLFSPLTLRHRSRNTGSFANGSRREPSQRGIQPSLMHSVISAASAGSRGPSSAAA
jgi:hypothetical protein